MHKLLKQHAETFDLKELKKLLEKTSYKKERNIWHSKVSRMTFQLILMPRCISGGYSQIGRSVNDNLVLSFMVKDDLLYYNFGIIGNKGYSWLDDVHFKLSNIKPCASVDEIKEMSDIEKVTYMLTIINILENKE